MKRLWHATLSSIAGLAFAARHEVPFRQELCVLALAIPCSFVIGTDFSSRAILIASILLVMLTEVLNTAFEVLSDHVTPERSPAIKAVKDLGSAAVMIAIAIAGLLWLAAAVQWLGR